MAVEFKSMLCEV